jgi:hypothetical protein
VAVTKGRTSANPLKVLGLTVLLAALLSVNYGAAALSDAASKAPIQLVMVAFVDTLLLSYFVISSRWTGRKEWGTVFAGLYGMVYLLTAIESVYLGSLLSASTVVSLLVNGAITSSIFAAALVWAFGSGKIEGVTGARLRMPGKEWVWKIVASAGVYLLLFIVFGLVVYAPLGRALDPVAYAQEQATASTSAALVFPIELLRGALWALLAVPAILALRFGWKKTGLVIGLLMAVPLAMTQFLATSMAAGLQVAHAGEIFGENLVFGLALVWILRARSRLPTQDLQT